MAGLSVVLRVSILNKLHEKVVKRDQVLPQSHETRGGLKRRLSSCVQRSSPTWASLLAG